MGDKVREVRAAALRAYRSMMTDVASVAAILERKCLPAMVSRCVCVCVPEFYSDSSFAGFPPDS